MSSTFYQNPACLCHREELAKQAAHAHRLLPAAPPPPHHEVHLHPGTGHNQPPPRVTSTLSSALTVQPGLFNPMSLFVIDVPLTPRLTGVCVYLFLFDTV